MSIAKFSPSTSNFYPVDMLDIYEKSGSLPMDLIDPTDAEISAFFKITPEEGKVLGTANGRPAWVSIPCQTVEQLVKSVQKTIDYLLSKAELKIAPLQDAVDLGIATTEETASLTAWKTYRVAVNRVPTQSGYPTTIDWPPMPE